MDKSKKFYLWLLIFFNYSYQLLDKLDLKQSQLHPWYTIRMIDLWLLTDKEVLSRHPALADNESCVVVVDR